MLSFIVYAPGIIDSNIPIIKLGEFDFFAMLNENENITGNWRFIGNVTFTNVDNINSTGNISTPLSVIANQFCLSGNCIVSWEAVVSGVHDQDLNTTNSVIFESININDNAVIEGTLDLLDDGGGFYTVDK